VKHRRVVFLPEAENDLVRLSGWIAERAGPAVAAAYVDRLAEYCLSFEIFAERGRHREDIRPGLRIVGFERRIAVAFVVEPEQVKILRLLYGGQQFEDG
jgi:toxin ParE1/3/4